MGVNNRMSQLFVDSIEPKTSGEVVSINRGKGQILEVFYLVYVMVAQSKLQVDLIHFKT